LTNTNNQWFFSWLWIFSNSKTFQKDCLCSWQRFIVKEKITGCLYLSIKIFYQPILMLDKRQSEAFFEHVVLKSGMEKMSILWLRITLKAIGLPEGKLKIVSKLFQSQWLSFSKWKPTYQQTKSIFSHFSRLISSWKIYDIENWGFFKLT